MSSTFNPNLPNPTARPTGARNVVYVDISSTNRNRRNYPSACDFVVPSQSNSSTNTNATSAADPVSLAYPTTGATLPPGQNVTGNTTSPDQIILDAATETTIENYYAGSYLEINGQYSLINSYDPATFTANLATPLTFVPGPGSVYYTRQALPVYTGAVQASALNTVNQFVVAPNANLASNAAAYTNSLVWFLPNGASTIGSNPSAIPLPLTSYSPTTHLITVQGNFPSVPQPGDQFELDPFSYDNFSPLLAFKGMGSNQASGGRCEVELVYLIVPNVFISSGYSGDFTSYPFLYLCIYNDGNQGSSQVMYSNSPVTEKVVFKIPVNEYSGDKSFICLKDAKQKQTLSLRFDQDIRITLTDPAGNTVSFVQADSITPAAPNPMLQISMLFAVRNV
jgi:hypothetical protein